MKPSQNSLFKADTYVTSIAESGILGLVHDKLRTFPVNNGCLIFCRQLDNAGSAVLVSEGVLNVFDMPLIRQVYACYMPM
jgi:hypothetical protein